MPNICNFSMKVTGNPENVEKFIDIIQADYFIRQDGTCIDFYTKQIVERHFWRVFEAEVIDDKTKNNVRSVIINGECAWSVFSCMCSGRGTYQSDNPGKNGTTLKKESARLHLSIEVFSEEPGCCFMEHMVYVNGKRIVDDCIDWFEYPTEYFETVEEINKAYKTNFTQREFEENEYLSVGGIEWCFDQWTYEDSEWENNF